MSGQGSHHSTKYKTWLSQANGAAETAIPNLLRSITFVLAGLPAMNAAGGSGDAQ